MPGKSMTNQSQGWHLEKSVSITHIISTLLIAASVLTWANSIDKRVQANTINIQNVVDVQRDGLNRIEREIAETNRKLGNIYERLLDERSTK